jgi:hypothetical protein
MGKKLGVFLIGISVAVILIALSSLNTTWYTLQQAKQDVVDSCKDLKVKTYAVKSALDNIPVESQTASNRTSWTNARETYNDKCAMFTGRIID